MKAVRIEPHETVATSTSDPPFAPAGLVIAARDAKAADINVSVGVGEVTFADGTTWRHRDDALSEVRLAGGSMETCTNEDISIVIDSLAKITTVGFKNGSALLVSREDSRTETPRLTFTCLLNGELATCPEAH